MPQELWLKFDRDWGWNLARLLAFTCIQSLFGVVGLLLIAVALAARLRDPSIDASIIGQVVTILPDQISVSAVESFERSLRDASLPLLFASLPISLWYGSRFFVVLEGVLAVVFQRRQRRFLSQNVAALPMVLLFAVLLPFITHSATVHPEFVTIVSSRAEGGFAFRTYVADDPGQVLLSTAASLVALFLLLFLAFALLTPWRIPFKAAWPGALLAAILTQLYITIFPIYTRLVLQPNHFGTVVGFVLVLFVFFAAFGLFIMAGAEVSAVLIGLRRAPEDLPATLAAARNTRKPVEEPVAVEATGEAAAV